MTPPEKHIHDADLAAGLRVTWVGLAVNLLLVGLKLWGGIIGRSQALIADAVHSVSDLFSDAVVLLGLRWGRKEADEDHPFGHGRIETIASLIVGLLLLVVGIGIAYNAVLSIYTHQASSPTLLAIVAAAASILIKEAMYWYTVIVGRRINSMAVIANAWHHRSDAMSSVAVLIGVAIVYFKPAWYLADAIAAVLVSFFILRVSTGLTWSAFKELADTAPDRALLREIRETAQSVTGAREIHDVMARRSGPYLLVELHVVVDKSITVEQGHAISKDVEHHLLHEIKGLRRVITHIDPDTKDHRESSKDT